MEISSSRPVSFTQVGNELDGLKNEVEAMSLVLRALVESHPAPAELVKRWRELSREPIEQTRPKGCHQGVLTRKERFYQALQRWSHTVHSAEVASPVSPPGRGLG
ncbi:MAG TPA: hypothetical protein VFH59_16640 [Frateuria sp.]|uniref:hypothetical protein n=1 Tax=Frateuria sp. TaxID=2211372 RepID=UPI002D7F49CE|nr:hypothetical protein [Frateuria sp.]HET6807065.1 hypothetical protein [Frateuria sp.]